MGERWEGVPQQGGKKGRDKAYKVLRGREKRTLNSIKIRRGESSILGAYFHRGREEKKPIKGKRKIYPLSLKMRMKRIEKSVEFQGGGSRSRGEGARKRR